MCTKQRVLESSFTALVPPFVNRFETIESSRGPSSPIESSQRWYLDKEKDKDKVRHKGNGKRSGTGTNNREAAESREERERERGVAASHFVARNNGVGGGAMEEGKPRGCGDEAQGEGPSYLASPVFCISTRSSTQLPAARTTR